jgi:nitrile hydratase subunit beta
MDGIHDFGGKQGFGKVPVGQDYVPFQNRADGVSLAVMMECTFDWSLDRARHVKELLPPVNYLSDPYFTGWAMTYMVLLIEAGRVTADEIITGHVSGDVATPALRTLPEVLERNRVMAERFDGPASTAPAFAIGDPVTTALHGQPGHTRLPAYARGKHGTIVAHHGTHVFPDEMALRHRVFHHLYTVAFDARDLFGDDGTPGHELRLDLWQPYLAPAGAGA